MEDTSRPEQNIKDHLTPYRYEKLEPSSIRVFQTQRGARGRLTKSYDPALDQALRSKLPTPQREADCIWFPYLI